MGPTYERLKMRLAVEASAIRTIDAQRAKRNDPAMLRNVEDAIIMQHLNTLEAEWMATSEKWLRGE